MKTMFFKNLVVVMMVLFVAISANAQKVVNGINTRDAKACNEYLKNNTNDTIVEEFKSSENGNRRVVRRSVYLNKGKLTARQDTLDVVVNPRIEQQKAVIAKLDTLSVETRVEHAMRGGQQEDIVYAVSAEAKDLRNQRNGDASDANAGAIVLKRANKYGWAVGAHAGYSYSRDFNGVIAGAGVGYDRRWWGIDLYGEVGKSKYSCNAIHCGESYWTYRFESILKIRPFQLDWLDQNRLFAFGGIGFENTRTDSAPLQNEDGSITWLSSRGNYLYATAGVAYEYRFFATGNVIGARLQWRNSHAIVQNSGNENFGTFALSAYFKFGFHRNHVNNGGR